MKIKRKLYWDLIIRYIMFLLAAVVITGMSLGTFVFLLLGLISDHPDEAQNLSIYFKNIEYDDRTKELGLPAEIEGDSWVEILQDNEVIHIEGNKQDDKMAYSQEELAIIANNADEIASEGNFSYEYIPFTGIDGESYTLLYKSTRDKSGNGVFKVGWNLPESMQGTDFERELSTRSKLIFSIFVSLVIILVLLFSRITSRKIITPLKEMDKGLKSVMNGNYSARMDFKGSHEFEEIRDAFNYMTERLQIAEEENRAIAESKKRLLLDISHDLRTPATTIQGYAEALCNDMVESEEDKKKYLSYIYEKSRIVTNLVDRLFKYTKLESSVYDLNKKENDLAEFLRNVVISFYGELDDKGFELDIRIPENKILFDFDEIELRRALDNIIANIIKYNDRHTTLCVDLSETDKKIQMIVGDDGVGISEEIRGSIFNALVRGDNARKSDGGTGLGLAISKKIIELHGGSIELESELEKGSRFIISFEK